MPPKIIFPLFSSVAMKGSNAGEGEVFSIGDVATKL